jgi:hypothetical protein
MIGNIDILVKELCKLPKEVGWVEFKNNVTGDCPLSQLLSIQQNFRFLAAWHEYMMRIPQALWSYFPWNYALTILSLQSNIVNDEKENHILRYRWGAKSSMVEFRQTIRQIWMFV